MPSASNNKTFLDVSHGLVWYPVLIFLWDKCWNTNTRLCLIRPSLSLFLSKYLKFWFQICTSIKCKSADFKTRLHHACETFPFHSQLAFFLLIDFISDFNSFSLEGEKQTLFPLFLYEPCFFDLGVEELLQYVGTLVVLAFRRVVFTAVGEDALHVGHEQFARGVVPALQTLAHRLQIWKSNGKQAVWRICGNTGN